MSDIIRAGHIRVGYIAAVPRLHSALLFRYTPMTGDVVEKSEAEIRRLDESKAWAFVAAQVTKHLRSWDEGGSEVEPINHETLRLMLHPKLYKLYRIIAGIAASDPHPEVDSDPARVGVSYADELLAEAMPGLANQEATAGN